jgi:DNA mismatch repair protein MutS
MMRQYLEMKSQHPDCILFFRLGDFYEMFFEDAVRGAEILGITLTARSKGQERVPMCGVPYHSARRYIARLIDEGLRVAICEQVEEPGSGPGIVRREVVRIVSPGTVLDEEVLDATQNNFLAALHWGERGAGAALLDVSTGDFVALDGGSLQELGDELARLEPRELVVPEEKASSPELDALRTALGKQPSVATVEHSAFDVPKASAYLRKHLGVSSLDGFGLKGRGWAVAAAGAALRYVKETQRTDAAHVDRLSVLERGQTLVLDEASLSNLEVIRTLRDGSRKGSLLGVLDRTVTSPGGRLLGRWLSAPLRSLPEIEARLDAVEELSVRGVAREELESSLRSVADLERILSRLCTGLGNARDLLGLSQSLGALPGVAGALERCEASLLRGLSPALRQFEALGPTLKSALLDEPSANVKEGGMIRPGFHAELDELVTLATEGKDFLLQLERRERERTGIGSLKVRYNRVFGYYLEVTRANLHLVPSDYIRKQTTVGAERFITSELKEYEEKVLHAEERRFALEYQLFEGLCAEVLKHASQLRAAAQAVATVDVLRAFAACAAEYGYVRPVVDDAGLIELIACRHPVVERMLKGEVFVPNDLTLDPKSSQLMILTGPNMAGKSTIMRQVALTVLMAQAGSFVPAKAARVGLCDRIFTRVGAADNLGQGQSTFMVEMTETSNILHHATPKSLVILDEIGRGTSTFDGLSIAWAVAEHLHDKICARTLFATHYHELTELVQEKERARNVSVAVKEADGRVVFLRKLLPEGASRSYGIEVARIAGLPQEVVARARELLQNLERREWDEGGHPRARELPLFADPPEAQARVVDELRATAVNALTPLEAINLIARWQKELM